MKDTRIATRYAKALFDLSKEQNLLERIDADMKMLHDLHAESKDFRFLLRSPVISQAKKNQVFKVLLSNQVHPLVLSFIGLMVRHNREAIIALVAKEFHTFYKQENGIVSVDLLSADPLSDKLRSEILDVIRKGTGSEVELSEKVDDRIIGGFVLQVENRQFDASILTKVKRLSREFNINVYEKGF